jgi:hypothetical protein
MKLFYEMSFKRIRIWCSVLILALAFTMVPSVSAKAGTITRIDYTTFRGNTSISTIHIGSDVVDISSNAFKGLNNLRSITVSANNPYYTSYSDCLYNKDLTELICFPAALKGAIIPDTVVRIGSNALYGLDKDLTTQIRGLVNSQASENMMEWEITGPHFIHTDYGIKWKDTDGTLKNPETDIMKLVASVVEMSTTGDMSQKKQLERCFDYFVKASVYERKMGVPEGDWTESYAKDILLNSKGNCYNFASAFAYIALGLGYEARVCTGSVTSALGGRTPHAWTEVKVGNNWYIFDAEMQRAKGSGYYKQTYDSYPAGPIIKEASYKVNY